MLEQIRKILPLGLVILAMVAIVGLMGFVNAAPPEANVSIIGGGTDNGERLNNSGSSFVTMFASGTDFASESVEQQVVPVAGEVSNLYIRLHIAPGAGKKFVFVARKNGADGGLTCEVAGATDTTCSDLTNTVTFVAGDLIDIEAEAVGTPTRPDMRWTAMFVADP